MNSIYDRLLILLCCSFFLDLNTNIKYAVIALLLAMAISEFNFVIEKNLFFYVSYICYFLLCLFMPQFFAFLPLLLYDSVWFHKMVLGIAVVFTAGYQLSQFDSVFTCLFFIMLHIISVIFAIRTMELNCLKSQLIKIPDTTKESQMELEARNQELIRQQDTEIYLATLKERNRIAREIHDNVGHLLSRSILMVGAAIAVNKNKESDELLCGLKDTLSQAMNSIRLSVHDLHDGAFDLKTSVEQLVNEVSFCKVELDYDMGDVVNRNIKYCFVSILKEAFSNIIRHSNATIVEVVLREHPGMYQLLIKDNGTGEKKTQGEGIGLTNMQDRVNALGGNITITSEKGFRIFVMIPRKQEGES